MNRVIQAGFVFVISFGACSSKTNFAVEKCLETTGSYLDCQIGCKVAKDDASCAKWVELTKQACAEIPKAKCQELCDSDNPNADNPTACELVKTMK